MDDQPSVQVPVHALWQLWNFVIGCECTAMDPQGWKALHLIEGLLEPYEEPPGYTGGAPLRFGIEYFEGEEGDDNE